MALDLTGTLTCILEAPASCSLALADDAHGLPSIAWSTSDGHSLPLDLSTELVLPRVWSEPVQELGLDEAGQSAWTALRERLAAVQGVELHGEDPQPCVVHRFLGYPDERTGNMPIECELRAAGIDLEGGPAFAHARAAELGPRSTRWRMLLQLSTDDLLGWSWGSGAERLYVWIDGADLAAGELSRTCTIIQ